MLATLPNDPHFLARADALISPLLAKGGPFLSEPASAILSEDGTHRYLLTRRLGDSLSEPDYCKANAIAFVMLNPSTADHETDDNTIRRCIAFAKRERFGLLLVVNLYAYRATDPSALFLAPKLLRRGPFREAVAKRALALADLIVCAWGSRSGLVHEAGSFLPAVLPPNPDLRHIGALTRNGFPRHPLYVHAKEPLLPFYPGTGGSAQRQPDPREAAP